MKIRLETVLKDFRGKALKEDMTLQDVLDALNKTLSKAKELDAGVGAQLEAFATEQFKDKRDMTLRSALLLMASVNVPDTSASERQALFSAAVKCVEADEVSLKSETISTLKKAAGKLFSSALVQEQVAKLLEGADPFAAEEAAKE